MPKVLIAIPCLDSIDVDFAQSLVQLHSEAEMSIAFLSGSLVYVARDKLALQAVEHGFDYVLWLDSDMIFPSSLLTDLLACEKDFVGGLCFRRRQPFTPVLYKRIRYGLTPEEYEHEEYPDYPSDSLFEVDACGFGAVLMKTDVISQVSEQFGHIFAPMRGFGEDISFCLRARQAGFEIWVDSRVKLGHVARMIADESTYRMLQQRSEASGASSS